MPRTTGSPWRLLNELRYGASLSEKAWVTATDVAKAMRTTERSAYEALMRQADRGTRERQRMVPYLNSRFKLKKES